MPTPVSVARECLTNEAARALDDAVSVARRRSHSQTTSLHSISALLSAQSSILRDACLRARGCAYSPRLHIRALEFSVGASLDRLPLCKDIEEPPIANSLMAAIKRSQANQKRHPESFHLNQIHTQNQTVLKVEIKHFILSILDDPTVSRVFGEAGFRSSDIKLPILHPPLTDFSRLSRNRCPPIFLCNLTGSGSGSDLDPVRRGFSFPFTGGLTIGNEDGDENSRRIGEVMVKKSGNNPLLIGVCASDALLSFTERLQGKRFDLLPGAISGSGVICIGKEVSEFVVGNENEEKMGLKFKEVGRMIEGCLGPGIVVNFGELNVLVSEDVVSDTVRFVVSELTVLVKIYKEKLWLIGAAGTYDIYSKFLALFPGIEKDWDLFLLPITSSKSSIEGFGSKPSLMKSFVPFGGFFSSPSNFTNPLSSPDHCSTRCHQCTEKYEQEVAAIGKLGSTFSVADQYCESLPPWLQLTELDPKNKGVDAAKTKDDGTSLSVKLLELQNKWNEICRRLHHNQQFTKLDISKTRFETSGEPIQVASDRKNTDKDSSVNRPGSVFPNPFIPQKFQMNLPSKEAIQVPEPLLKGSKIRHIEMESRYSPHTILNMEKSLPHSSVTTDLGLGTLYTSTSHERNHPRSQDHKEYQQHILGSIDAKFNKRSEITSSQVSQIPFDPRESKSLRIALNEKVGYQEEAICAISEAISRCRSGNGTHRSSNSRGDIWLTFLGPDKIGKRKISLALAEVMFGNRDNLISVDLGSEDKICEWNSLFKFQDLDGYDVKFRGKTVADYVAEELRKKPNSVVFLENVDKADHLVQNTLFQAIKRGKFPDSHGREISINNMIFVITSKTQKKTFPVKKEPVEFFEEVILEAKNFQMQILFRQIDEDLKQTSGMNVIITPTKGSSKRKLVDRSDSVGQGRTNDTSKRAHKASMSYFDLNRTVEEIEEEINDGDLDSDSGSNCSEAWLEDFLDLVDERVIFKPFDFNQRSDKVVKEINLQLKRLFGCEVRLEIEYEVMVQILAASWLSDREKAVQDWVERILGKSFIEAREKYKLSSHSVLKLVSCEGHFVEEQVSGICLPARIKVD